MTVNMVASFFPFVLCAAMLLVIAWDATHYIIPNWLNALLLILYPLWWFTAPAAPDWAGALGMFALCFAVGFGLFALGLMGAGDVKLLSVLGLYVGFSEAGLALIIYMALLGGVLSLLLIILRRVLAGWKRRPRLLRKKEPVPYGLAIAGSFLWLLFTGRVPGMAEINVLAFV